MQHLRIPLPTSDYWPHLSQGTAAASLGSAAAADVYVE